jgi:hypothetical protein
MRITYVAPLGLLPGRVAMEYSCGAQYMLSLLFPGSARPSPGRVAMAYTLAGGIPCSKADCISSQPFLGSAVLSRCGEPPAPRLEDRQPRAWELAC